jgi:hypothetical protein
MKKMLLATGGNVFTLKTLTCLVECSALRTFVTKRPASEESPVGPVGPVTEKLASNRSSR